MEKTVPSWVISKRRDRETTMNFVDLFSSDPVFPTHLKNGREMRSCFESRDGLDVRLSLILLFLFPDSAQIRNFRRRTSRSGISVGYREGSDRITHRQAPEIFLFILFIVLVVARFTVPRVVLTIAGIAHPEALPTGSECGIIRRLGLRGCRGDRLNPPGDFVGDHLVILRGGLGGHSLLADV